MKPFTQLRLQIPLKSYVSRLGNDLAITIPSGGKNTKTNKTQLYPTSFLYISTTFSEIEDEIFNDDILKRVKTFLSKPLEIIFNTSVTSGIVLTDIKLANIIPVFKKSSHTCSSNYRPISLPSVFHIKLLEKFMYSR